MKKVIFKENNKNLNRTISFYLYNKTRHSYIYIYMLRIAIETTGSIGLNLFVETHGWPGLKNRDYFFKCFLFHGPFR